MSNWYTLYQKYILGKVNRIPIAIGGVLLIISRY